MGASVSSNVASAVTNVVNQISNSTDTNSQQVQNISNNVDFKNCNVKAGSMSITSSATTIQKSNQIATALQNTHVKNDLQQKMLQAAQSTVGSLGVGFADASNSANMMANSTTDISNTMNTISGQVSNTNNSFNCQDSTFDIAGKFDISLISNADFLSTQTVQNKQVASVVNKVSQTADQKATAKVEGIGAALLCMAILVLAFGWSFSKTVTAVADNEGSKKIWYILGIVLIICLFVIAYLSDWPPFFGKTNECIMNDTTSGCTQNCIDFDTGSITLQSTPVRYIHPITSAFMPAAVDGVNLLQMAILVSAGENSINGGYNVTNFNNLQARIDHANTIYGPLIKNPNLGTMPNLLVADTVLIPNAFFNGGQIDSGTCTPGAFIKNIPGGTPIQFGQQATGGQINCPETGTLGTQSAGSAGSDYILANINDDGLNNWMNCTDLSLKEPDLSNAINDRALFARFVLSDIIGTIPLSIYISNNELVKYIDDKGNTVVTVGGNPDAQKYCYQFKPYNPYNFKSSCLTGGLFTGQIGVCDDKDYKMKHFSDTYGLYILLGILGVALLAIAYNWWQSRAEAEEQPSDHVPPPPAAFRSKK